MPSLVVTQALPGSGKTVITSYLEKEFDFTRLSVEDYLRARHGKDWWEKGKKKGELWWENAWQKGVFEPAKQSLARKRSVTVDTTAGATKWLLEKYRLETLFLKSKAEGYLLELEVKPAIRYARISQRHGISLKEARKWDSIYNWNSRWKPGPPIKILKYPNNVPEDLERIKSSLKKSFR